MKRVLIWTIISFALISCQISPQNTLSTPPPPPPLINDDEIVVLLVKSNTRPTMDGVHFVPAIDYLDSQFPNQNDYWLGFTAANINNIYSYDVFNTNYIVSSYDLENIWRIRRPQYNYSQEDMSSAVAIIDFGILPHVEFMDRLKPGYTFGVLQPISYDGIHGGACAGLIAAKKDYAGITGINPDATIVSCAINNIYEVALAIIWCVDNHIPVINISLQYYEPCFLLDDAIKYAYQQGTIIVAAVGNGPVIVSIPANHPYVIAVAGTDYSNMPWVFSNWGPEVDFAAQAKDVYTSFGTMDYDVISGTSFAAPYISGWVSLIKTKYPEYSFEQVYQILQDCSVDIPPIGHDWFTGHGIIDPDKIKKFLNQPQEQG